MNPIDNPKEVQIPRCCIEGDPDCPHAVNKSLLGKKTNIAL